MTSGVMAETWVDIGYSLFSHGCGGFCPRARVSGMQNFRLSLVPGNFAVCKLPADAPIPSWTLSSSFLSVTRTEEELSVVCKAEVVPAEVQSQKPWCVF